MRLEQYLQAGAIAGAATLVWHQNKVIHRGAIGAMDVETGAPMARNTIFRIASMTKPITSTMALMLVDEGRIRLDEPISRWAPEFARMRVLRSPVASLDDTVEADRPITFDDLLTHRAGFTYGAFHPGPLADAHRQALGGDIDSHVEPDRWMAGLASLPLIDQPGAGFHYGHSTDLLGLLIARIEDAPLGDVLQRRIFGPLGMADTGFIVPRDARTRCAALHGFDDTGRLVRRGTGPGNSTLPERPADMAYVSGGQGLWSTADDYLRFARIFLGDGEVDGVRLLDARTLAAMTSNRLSSSQRKSAEVAGWPLFAEGHGFGMGVAVVLEPEKAVTTICGGRAGSVGWPGGFGGWWQADRADQSVSIFLTHNIVEPEQFARGIGLGVYGAITEFQRYASDLVGADA